MLLMGALLPLAAKNRAQQVITHRGYWKTVGTAQNSLAALYNAHNIGVYGSEFDVHITRDGVVVVFHDDDIEGIKIEDANYADIKNKRLSNGETLPTLAAYLAAAQSLGHTRLILEVKEHAKKSDEDRCVDATLRQVAKAHLADRVEYISFSKHACDYLVANAPPGRQGELSQQRPHAQASPRGRLCGHRLRGQGVARPPHMDQGGQAARPHHQRTRQGQGAVTPPAGHRS